MMYVYILCLKVVYEHLKLSLIIIACRAGVKYLNYILVFQKMTIYLNILMYIGLKYVVCRNIFSMKMMKSDNAVIKKDRYNHFSRIENPTFEDPGYMLRPCDKALEIFLFPKMV